MLVFKGKAILIMDRLEANKPSEFHWDIHPYIQSINKDDPGGELTEAFSFIMAWDYHPAPKAAYRMAVGDRLVVAVTYEWHYTRGDGYTTDDDSELYLTKERVLYCRPYNDKHFRKKFYSTWKKFS